MTKILGIEDFINESMMAVTRMQFNQLNISNITMRCKWDGENWNYYDREGRGTLDDFKALGRNRNTNFDMNFKVDFELMDNEGDYIDDITSVNIKMRIHYYNMAENDYDIIVDECDDADALKSFIDECNVTDEFNWDDFRLIIKKSWGEHYVGMELGDELEDALGKQDFDKIKNEILEKLTTAICNECE